MRLKKFLNSWKILEYKKSFNKDKVLAKYRKKIYILQVLFHIMEQIVKLKDLKNIKIWSYYEKEIPKLRNKCKRI